MNAKEHLERLTKFVEFIEAVQRLENFRDVASSIRWLLDSHERLVKAAKEAIETSRCDIRVTFNYCDAHNAPLPCPFEELRDTLKHATG